MKSKSSLWIKVHLIFPFIPFVIETILRIVITQNLRLESFNASTFALTIALLCLFISQSLYSSGYIAENKEEKTERHSSAENFKYFMFFAFSLFVALIIFDEVNKRLVGTVSEGLFSGCLITFEIITFILIIPSVYLAVDAQQSYKLNTTI